MRVILTSIAEYQNNRCSLSFSNFILTDNKSHILYLYLAMHSKRQKLCNNNFRQNIMKNSQVTSFMN